MNIYSVVENELNLRNLNYGTKLVKDLTKPEQKKLRRWLFPMLSRYGISTDRKIRIHVLQCIFSSITIQSSDDLDLNQIYLLRDAEGSYIGTEICNEIQRIQRTAQRL